jgi:hypothetical protein
MIDNANTLLKLQYKIDNLTGSETIAELRALRATTDLYPTIDITDLETAIQAKVTALANGSAITEVVTVAQASADLISKEDSEINDVKLINSKSLKFIDSKGYEWLRTGWLDPDIDNYPDATVSASTITGIDSAFDISSEVTTARSISFDKVTEKIYVLDVSTNTCRVYDSTGVYLSETASLVSGDNASCVHIEVHNDIIYILSSLSIYSYTSSGVYVEKLPYDFTNANGAFAYDYEANTFFTTNTGGLGGSVEVLYLNQNTGESGRFGIVGASGYSIYGLGLCFGQLYLSVYSSGNDTNKIFTAKYIDYTGSTLLIDHTEASSAFNIIYGFTATKDSLLGVSDSLGVVVKFDADIGVGVAESISVNNNEELFYYTRNK